MTGAQDYPTMHRQVDFDCTPEPESNLRRYIAVSSLAALADDWDLKGYEADNPQHAAYGECAARLRGLIERVRP